MNTMFTLFALILTLPFAAWAEGEEPAAAATEAVAQAFEAPAWEGWFFSFLEKLLNLLAGFVIQILNAVFGGIGGLF